MSGITAGSGTRTTSALKKGSALNRQRTPQQLFEANQGLVGRMLRKWSGLLEAGQGWEPADVRQVADAALWIAATRYDPSRGAFSTYASITIHGALSDFHQCGRRRTDRGIVEVSLSDPIDGDSGELTLEDVIVSEESAPGASTLSSEGVQQLLGHLRPRHRAVLVETVIQDMTLDAWGRANGVNRARASVIRRQAIAALQKQFRPDEIKTMLAS